MKKLLFATLIITLAVSYSPFTQAAAYGGGTGTALSPYQIWTPQQMNTIGANPADWNKHFVLMDNIDMSIYTGTQYNIIGKSYDHPFRGTFNGNGYVIHNLTYITTKAVDCIGLFGCTTGATIQNLGVENVLILSRGNNVGGLVGSNESGSITACYATGSVSGTNCVGGLVGWNVFDTLTVVCYATGSVSGTNCVGGLVGKNHGTLTACYATGSVNGTDSVGGLVGLNYVFSLTACYATGLVSGTNSVGGLVGSSEYGWITACFWDIQTCGQMTSSGGGTGKTTAEMQILATFIDAGWDFAGESANGLNDYWKIEVNGYPHFTVHAWTLEGKGTSDSPYIVANPADLGKVWLRPSACYRLAGNLDLSGISWSSAVVPLFTGSFEGRGFVISNLMINWPDSSYMGLFGKAEAGSRISNLGLENVNLTGCFSVGGLVGENDGTLTACYVTGSVSGTFSVGGLVGINDGGTLTACYATDSVNGTDSVGGLVGLNIDGALTACYATSSVSGTDDVGGLVGGNSGPLIACYATGSVKGIYTVGGLLGGNYGTLTTCYATGSASGTDYVGGLVGWNDSGTLTVCYAAGSVSGIDYVGGLVGLNNYCTLTFCYATGSVNGTDYVGGLMGSNDSGSITACFWDIQTCGQTTSADGIGKTTAEMQTLATFTSAGWDFVGESANGLNDYWKIEVNGYPHFTVHAWTLEGKGTSDSPYIVANVADLGEVWLRPSACYRLAGNLDLSGISWSSAVVPVFAGSFDGKGFAISNLMINWPDSNNIGLFGKADAGSRISNLGLENVNLTGSNVVGGLVGENDGTLMSCYVTGSISGNDCVGGLVGFNGGSLTACYATGPVNGTDYVGGLVGDNVGALTVCYAAGLVSGTGRYVGGLVGRNAGTLTDCFWDIETSSQSEGVGLGSSSGATGLDTAEMMTLSTFVDADWDFSETNGDPADWMLLREGEDYPRLAWQTIYPGDIAGLYGVNIADLTEVIDNWLRQDCPTECEQADIDNSGTVDLADLSILASDWMK